jgi:class 3 adenylate cyclase
VTQLAGDTIVAVFGTGETAQAGEAALAAAQAAQEMLELAALFNGERSAGGKAPLTLGIGIASGEIVAGHAGTPRRTSFVCIGAAVQRAAALGVAAARHDGAALIDGATHAALAGRIATDAVQTLVLAGSATAVPVHALKAKL